MNGLYIFALACLLLAMLCISFFYYHKNVKCTNYVILFRIYEFLCSFVTIGASLGTLEAIGKDNSGVGWWFLVFVAVGSVVFGVSYLIVRLCKHIWKPVSPEDIVTKQIPQSIRYAFTAVMCLLGISLALFMIFGIKKGIEAGAETSTIVGCAIVAIMCLAYVSNDIVKTVKALRRK